jgi:2-polyprenyl-3-methyl-5-hydroxy-6-metoxy-1,4-benzoquinol methylase
MMNAEELARSTAGTSALVLYRLVRRLTAEARCGGALLDVGCGHGLLWPHVAESFERYVAIDVVRYPELPKTAQFHKADLNGGEPLPVADGIADVTTALGVVEYLENPRALVRELARVTRSGGLVLVSTPNHASLAGRLVLLCRGRIQSVHTHRNPAAITTMLGRDLLRAASDAGLVDTRVVYTDEGRIPATPWRWPALLRGALFSDGVMLSARKA